MSSDHRALSREYKQTPRTMGVGVVRNTVNGKLLLLASVDIPALLNRQRAELRFGGHRNRALQQDWKEAGEAAFAFEVLDTLAPKDAPGWDPAADLQELERLWQEKLSPYEPAGYTPRPKP
jgi:hypothetical protein